MGPASRCRLIPAVPWSRAPEAVTVVDVIAINFEERDLEARVPDLAAGGAWTRPRLRWRRDPPPGPSPRVLPRGKLQPPTPPGLAELPAQPALSPFDSAHLETGPFPFPPQPTAPGPT